MKYCGICENNSEIINKFKTERDYKIIIKLEHFLKDGTDNNEILDEYKENEFCNINLMLNYYLDDVKIYKFFVLDNIIHNDLINYILSIYKINFDNGYDEFYIDLFFMIIETYINDKYKLSNKKNYKIIDNEIYNNLIYFLKNNLLDEKDNKNICIINILKKDLDFEKLTKFIKYVIIK